MGFMEPVLDGFGFQQMRPMITLVSTLMLLGNFFGGLMTSILIAYSGPAKDRPTFQRLSTRLCIAGEIFLIIFIFYYHGFVAAHIELPHAVYWTSTLIMAPLLAYIGAQITYLVYQKKIEANFDAYRRWELAKKRKAAEAQGKAGDVADARG